MRRSVSISWNRLAMPLLFLNLLFAVACGTLEVGIEPDASPVDTAVIKTPVTTPAVPNRTVTGQIPTPTSILDGSHLSFSDPALGLSLDIPLWWETRSSPGAVTRFVQMDATGAERSVLTLSTLNPSSTTLELALEEVSQGAWGPHIHDVQSVTLGAFAGLRLELSPGDDRPPLVWLVVAPCGRAVGIIPQVDPAWIEPVIEVVLDTLQPIPVTSSVPTTSEPAPAPTTAPSTTETVVGTLSGLQEPLLIDGEQGWIFASAQVDGQPRTVKLATQDGRLLAAYDVVGKLALDRTGGRLFVDQGQAGVAILDAATGVLQATVALPTVGPASAEPQVDPNTGLAYLFRDTIVYVLDPLAATVTQAFTLSIPSTVCDDPGDDAPIARSFYDLVNNQLYLGFITRVCTPWVQQTIVAYDAATMTELGRYSTELGYQAVPYSDSLYGTTAGRLGRNVSWAWNGHDVWFEQGDDGRILQGIVADWGRGLVYEALDGQIWVLTPYPREVSARTDAVALNNGGRLVGHDPISDQLYFLSHGRLQNLPTSAVLEPSTQQTDVPPPYCRPSEAVVTLLASSATVKVGQVVSVTVSLDNSETTGVRLGQPQYILDVQPPGILTADSLGPVVHPLTLEPGQWDVVGFQLQAVSPGQATLTAFTDFEIHALDMSSGSWSGCDSWPLEIVVTP
jgi:hypothetical protein